MAANANILISGGGIAGLTLAYWLKKFGFNPTVVEKRSNFSDRGYMLDFYGSGYDVAEKMGLVDALKTRHYPISNLNFVDPQGRVKAVYRIDTFRELLHWRHFNFLRGDLEDILYEKVRNTIPIRYNSSVEHLEPLDHQVTVTFNDGDSQRYDLVIGADGIHSNIRRFLWGSEEQASHYLGYYVACSMIQNFLTDQQAFYTFMQPNRQVSIYPIDQKRLATLMVFPSAKQPQLSHDQQLNLLEQIYSRMGWVVPEVLRQTRESGALYFDSVTQIRLPEWYKGRVALVGDAAYCLTLLSGQGASIAMAGAYLLANALNEAKGDYQLAFAAYQAQLKPEIVERQKKAEKLAASFVPGSQRAIWFTLLFLKLAFLPGFRSLLLSQAGAKSIIK